VALDVSSKCRKNPLCEMTAMELSGRCSSLKEAHGMTEGEGCSTLSEDLSQTLTKMLLWRTLSRHTFNTARIHVPETMLG